MYRRCEREKESKTKRFISHDEVNLRELWRNFSFFSIFVSSLFYPSDRSLQSNQWPLWIQSLHCFRYQKWTMPCLAFSSLQVLYSLLYTNRYWFRLRNNVVASEPVRIFCVACQKPRRRINRGSKRSTNAREFPGLTNSSVYSYLLILHTLIIERLIWVDYHIVSNLIWHRFHFNLIFIILHCFRDSPMKNRDYLEYI